MSDSGGVAAAARGRTVLWSAAPTSRALLDAGCVSGRLVAARMATLAEVFGVGGQHPEACGRPRVEVAQQPQRVKHRDGGLRRAVLQRRLSGWACKRLAVARRLAAGEEGVPVGMHIACRRAPDPALLFSFIVSGWASHGGSWPTARLRCAPAHRAHRACSACSSAAMSLL